MPSTRIFTSVAAAIGGILVALAPGFTQPAWAAPSGCSSAIVDSRTVKATCGSGTGEYRAVATCVTENDQRRTTAYGTWRSAATWVSIATCPSSSPYAIHGSSQTR